MRKTGFFLLPIVLMALASSAQAQNWSVVVQDNAAGTPANQVNGLADQTAALYGTIFNFTGTPGSDDGTGTNTPVPMTLLDFGGFGFTQNSGQYDLNSLFTPADAPGLPTVDGSANGSVPGSSGYRSFGTFDLSGLAPGHYQEDFTATAFPDDFTSTVPFDDISGTLTLNVVAPAAVPEASTFASFGVLLALGGVGVITRRRMRCTAKP